MRLFSMDRHPARHHPALIALHWVMAAMVALAFMVILTRLWVEDTDQRLVLLDIHRSIGLGVLALLLLRVTVRLTWGREAPFFLPPVLRMLSAISHGALYLILLILPLLGWAQSSARAHHFKIFGVTLPSLVSYDVDRADQFGEWHETLAWVFLGLIALHILAALWHHYIRKDGILHAMMPGKSEG